MLRLFLRLLLLVFFSCFLAVTSVVWVPPGWTASIEMGAGGVPEQSLGERIEAGKEGDGAGITEKIEVWTDFLKEKTRQSIQVFLRPVKNVRLVLGCGNLLFRAGVIFLFLFLWVR